MQLNGGVFSVLLGESPQPALTMEFNVDYWIQVTFQGEDQFPRQRLVATGYAYMASGLGAGTVVTGNVTWGGLASVKGVNTATSGLAYGVWGESSSPQAGGVVGFAPGFGVAGQATGSSGINYGVMGSSNSTQGKGVYGEANASSGGAYGGHFETASNSGRGVYGIANAAGGLTYGGFFQSVSTIGRGVVGIASSTIGVNYGSIGQTASPDGFGVYGLAQSYSGIASGVHGYSHGTAGRGVWGKVDDATGYTIGVLGESISANGTGVSGVAYATTGTTYGVLGATYSATGVGVRAVGYGSGSIALSARAGAGGLAAEFEGNVRIRERDSGDVIMELGEGLDYAEGFDVSTEGAVEPGTVLIIDPDAPGELAVCSEPYDSRVAGIIAGANGLGSAVKVASGRFDYDVALAGRVYCLVDATKNAVHPGDLLTTSDKPGHAMKATDSERAQGAVLGKAMESLARGREGQILVLVTLQ